MKIHRIYAIILRYIFLFKRSFDRLSEIFYWPSVDLILWGLTSYYIKSFAPNAPTVILVFLSGILLWIIVKAGQHNISVNLLEDIWNKNLINIFVSPLKFSEWIIAFIFLGLIKAVFGLAFALLVSFILFKVQIFFYGFYLIPFMLLLLMTGWWMGFFVAGLILRYGTRVQTLAWTLIFLISPFSAIYYPVGVLPSWAQFIAKVTPISYVFEGSREIIFKNSLDMKLIYTSFILNVIYLALSIIFLKKSFNKILEKGLVKIN